MLTLGNSKVKHALLTDITRLCIFMGRKRVNNELLPHLITVLNDRDWQLRAGNGSLILERVGYWCSSVAHSSSILVCCCCILPFAAFFEHIVGVSVFVGRAAFQVSLQVIPGSELRGSRFAGLS